MSVWRLFHSHTTRQHFTEQEITILLCFAFVFGARVSLCSLHYSGPQHGAQGVLELMSVLLLTGGYPKHNSPSPQRCMSDSSQGQTLHS